MSRADGLLGEVLGAATALPVATDPVLALALAAMLLALSLDAIQPPLFASAQASRLASSLLQVWASPPGHVPLQDQPRLFAMKHRSSRGIHHMLLFHLHAVSLL